MCACSFFTLCNVLLFLSFFLLVTGHYRSTELRARKRIVSFPNITFFSPNLRGRAEKQQSVQKKTPRRLSGTYHQCYNGHTGLNTVIGRLRIHETSRVWRQKTWRLDAFPDPQANYMQLQVRRAEVVVVVIRIGQPSFVYSLWVHCDFDLMISLEREACKRARRLSSGRGRLPPCWTAAATRFYWKSPRRGKIHAVQRPNGVYSLKWRLTDRYPR